MQRCTLFFSSFLEFHVPGKTHDSYHCWTAHIHKSCQNCLKGNPQLLYQHGHVIIFQILLQKECFIITLTSQWIIQMNSTESHTHTHTHTQESSPNLAEDKRAARNWCWGVDVIWLLGSNFGWTGGPWGVYVFKDQGGEKKGQEIRSCPEGEEHRGLMLLLGEVLQFGPQSLLTMMCKDRPSQQ